MTQIPPCLFPTERSNFYLYDPALFVDGIIFVTEYDGEQRAIASNPRTAIGMTVACTIDLCRTVEQTKAKTLLTLKWLNLCLHRKLIPPLILTEAVPPSCILPEKL